MSVSDDAVAIMAKFVLINIYAFPVVLDYELHDGVKPGTHNIKKYCFSGEKGHAKFEQQVRTK